MSTAINTTDISALVAGTWNIDPSHSEIGFTVRHLGLAKVRGRFNTFSGSIEINPEPTKSAVRADIELSSVDTNNPDRDGHLQSTDFFGIETAPTMTFVSTGVTHDTLSGNLTIRGVTKPVDLDLEYFGVATGLQDEVRAGFSASGKISRSDFGVDFNAPLGVDGMLVGDKVTIELEVSAIKQ